MHTRSVFLFMGEPVCVCGPESEIKWLWLNCSASVAHFIMRGGHSVMAEAATTSKISYKNTIPARPLLVLRAKVAKIALWTLVLLKYSLSAQRRLVSIA